MGIVEEVGGIGDLFTSETLIRSGVRYYLTVRSRTVLGMTDVEPWIDLTEAESHTYLGETLTLHLQDGRWFNFIVLSSSGTVAPAGGGIRDSR
jgi:hypothetical protein